MSTAKVKAAAVKTSPQAAPAAAAIVPAAVTASPLAAATDTGKQIEQAVAAGKDAVEQVVAVGKEAVEQVVKASTESVEQVVKASKEAAAKGYEKAVELTKDQVDAAVKAQAAAFLSYEEAVGSAKDAVDALVKAGTTFNQGLQDIGKLVLGLAQASVEQGVAASQQLLTAKTLHELVDLQSSLAKQQFDRLLNESSRLSELSVKLVEESFSPLTDKVTATVEKLVKRAA